MAKAPVIDILEMELEHPYWLSKAGRTEGDPVKPKRTRAEMQAQHREENRAKLAEARARRHARVMAQDYNPNHEPAGSPIGGQFASGGGSGGGADIEKNMAVVRGSPQQPVKSLDELYARARKAEPVFKQTIDALAKATGGQVKYTPPASAEPGTTLKSRASAERKMRDEEGGDPGGIRDVLRATIMHERVQDSRKAAAKFIKDMGDKILVVKDRFMAPVGGYRDLMVNFRTDDGLTAEVQFNTKHMTEAKAGAGHKLYERLRSLRVTGELTKEQIAELESDSHALYEEAYKKDGNGKGWKS